MKSYGNIYQQAIHLEFEVFTSRTCYTIKLK